MKTGMTNMDPLTMEARRNRGVSEDENTEQHSDGPGSGKSKPSAVTARSEEPSIQTFQGETFFKWSPRMKSFHQWGR